MDVKKNKHLGQFPDVINEKQLVQLCEKYRDEIGRATIKGTAYPRIRYVIGRDQFGYANFGDYFFAVDDGLYVWHNEKEYEEDHNPDVVEDFFGHPCEGRGYTCRHIFAGIDTGYDDSEGKRMFTGDIVVARERGGYELGALCLAAWPGRCDDGFYGFPLDNHSLRLDMCTGGDYFLKSIGTIFYQLDPCDEPEPIWHKALGFNRNYWTKEERSNDLVMARYTPNFDKEEWKYLGLEILGAEFEWDKIK